MEHECGKQCPHCPRNRLDHEMEIIVPVSCNHPEALSLLVSDIGQLPGVSRIDSDIENSCVRIWGDDREVSLDAVAEMIDQRGCRLDDGES